MVRKNKRGWIKIVEAFLAILLLMGILLIIVGGDDSKFEKGKVVREAQNNFLHNIQINTSFRKKILELTELPINSNETDFPVDLKNYFWEEFENCFMNICLPSDECTLDFESKGEIYSKEVLINSYRDIYSPRKIKIICYEDEI